MGQHRLIGNYWIVKRADKLEVNLNFIVIRYIKYYWEFFFKFKLRRSHSPLDANVNRILGQFRSEPRTPSLESLLTDKFVQLRKEVIEKSIKPEVLIHLDPQGELYKRISGRDIVIIDLSLIHFFRRYRWILVSALNFMITRYLEKINFVPRIAEKVSGNIPRTHLNEKEKGIILELHDSCFYCNRKSDEAYNMDHVIPFNYIYQTEIFNIVPACTACNSSKNDRLPTQELFERVKNRNSNLILRKDYNPEWYEKLYETCLPSYHGNRTFFDPLKK